jgi:hypothetical protein
VSEQAVNKQATSRPNRTLGQLTQRMREVLGRGDLATENHRKAALRQLLHEHTAGLSPDEITALVTELRGRFPDRIFESVSSARGLADKSATLEREVTELREERDRLRQRLNHFETIMSRLTQAAATPAGQTPGTMGGSILRSTGSVESEEMLAEIATLFIGFALSQEVTARSVEEALGIQDSAAADTALATLLPRLAQGESITPDEIELVRSRLRALQLLPGALMSGAQQSWKGGTREILEHLDPKGVEQEISGVLKFPAIQKEVKRRFEQFWSQFDRNVDHYYRGRFERVYRDKMEDR